jgi:hypothetical protein
MPAPDVDQFGVSLTPSSARNASGRARPSAAPSGTAYSPPLSICGAGPALISPGERAAYIRQLSDPLARFAAFEWRGQAMAVVGRRG